MDIDRPLKVKLDVVKLRIGQKFLNKLLRELQFESVPKTSQTGQPEKKDEDLMLGLILPAVLQKISLKTSQFVFVVRLAESTARFSVHSSKFDIGVKLAEENESKIFADFEGVRAQIRDRSTAFKTLIGPFCGRAALEAANVSHSGSDRANFFDPKLNVSVELDDFSSRICPIRIQAIQTFITEIENLIRATAHSACEGPEISEVTASEIKNEIFENDLHSGNFEFITAGSQGPDSDREPIKPKTVIFRIGSAAKLGSFTWRYKQPRVLKSLFFTPVPMIHEVETEEITKVKCELQYFDELMREFVPFKIFDVNELDGTHVPIEFSDTQAKGLKSVTANDNQN